MDPMDYAFNHPSSSEAPYHIAVSNVSAPWLTYTSGPDVGTDFVPLYLQPAAGLPLPFPPDPSAYISSNHHLAQNGPLVWPSGLSHSSAPRDHALSRSRPFEGLLRQGGDRTSDRREDAHGLQPSTINLLPDLHHTPHGAERNLNSAATHQPSPTDGCFRNHQLADQQAIISGLGPDHNLENQPSALDNNVGHGLTGQPQHTNTGAILLPSLRSQPYFHTHFTPALTPDTRSAAGRANPTVSFEESTFSRPEQSSAPSISTTSSHTRTRPQSPVSRSRRAIRTAVLDGQRPISAVSFDASGSSRLPATAPPASSAAAATSSSPRRQRQSRTGARHHMASPRLSAYGHSRHAVDRALIQDFLASQNFGPNDKSGIYSYAMVEDSMYRNLVSLQATMGSAMIARRSMVKSLRPVPHEELPENDKVCSICYGDYGVKSPEGTIEDALRLPNCNHVFGSRCLQTWFEESDKCPYCRKKVPAEPKWFFTAAKRLLAHLRRAHQPSADAADNETYLSVVRGYGRGGSLDEFTSPSPPLHHRFTPGRPRPDTRSSADETRSAQTGGFSPPGHSRDYLSPPPDE